MRDVLEKMSSKVHESLRPEDYENADYVNEGEDCFVVTYLCDGVGYGKIVSMSRDWGKYNPDVYLDGGYDQKLVETDGEDLVWYSSLESAVIGEEPEKSVLVGKGGVGFSSDFAHKVIAWLGYYVDEV
jgi:hypothetical protein